MKNELTRHDIAVQKESRRKDARVSAWTASRCVRLGLVGSLGASLALMMNDNAPRAQQRYTEPSVKVTSVTTSGNVVSISADGSLNRAQTWQDPDGKFHVVLVNGQIASGAARGVTAQRVGNSLELVVPVRRGASVTVEPRGNRLDLVVTGGQAGALNVENFPVGQREDSRARASEPRERESAPREQEESYAAQPSQRRRNQPESSQSPAQQSYSPQRFAQPESERAMQQPAAPTPSGAAGLTRNAEPNAESHGFAPPPGQAHAPIPAEPTQTSQGAPADAAPANLAPAGSGFLSWVTSMPALLFMLGAGLLGGLLLLLRRRRSRSESEEGSEGDSSKNRLASAEAAEEESAKPFKHFSGDRRRSSMTVPFERRRSGRGAEDEAMRRQIDAEAKTAEGGERALEFKAALQLPTPVIEFGAYRIDQEVASLVSGGPHSTGVLSSRAADDRRAVETSLLKALRAPETDDDGRHRARIALEDYGFVARSCASLLLGAETFERVSAARALGDMKSTQSLPFLTEALYDHDPLVRTECVQSLGALGLPSAIGALLDAARHHQDIPAAVL
ncbi:MAG TPA: HEAT repeat domain-containing protein, partial [Pyrinomonadaceae bacterium]|nr:HEAT repeat domain-containing protein [Pyrinomonadaceae bacterium]